MKTNKPAGSRPIDTNLTPDELAHLQIVEGLSDRQWNELSSWEQMRRIRQFRLCQQASQQTEPNRSA